MSKMIQHFKFKRLYAGELPGWRISFYDRQQKVEALYHGDGSIELESPKDYALNEQQLKDIHELMLFHIYD